MTAFDLKKLLQKKLEEAKISNADEEARLLTEHVCEIAHADFLFKRGERVSEEKVQTALSLVERRKNAEPLQYLLGKWEFMGLEFYVGKGVLIPRPETEELCETVTEKLKDKANPVIFDLCSGSGCIGLSLKHFLPNAKVYMVEKSSEALFYLNKNREALGLESGTTVLQGDILGGFESFDDLSKPDVIVSNPPYIKTEEIATLQKEVQNEPFMALDGGEDGYIFYEVLAKKWMPYLNKGGFIAVECGEEQAQTIAKMFKENAKNCETVKDFNNIERMVFAEV